MNNRFDSHRKDETSKDILVDRELSSYNSGPMKRRLWFDRNRQISFIFSFIKGIAIAVSVPIFYALVLLFMMSQHSELTPHQKDVLVYGFNQLVGQSFLIAAGVFLVVGAVALYFSKKILGPIYRVEKWSRFQLQSNSIETLVVRKSDELSQVSESLNRKIEKIKELV